MENLKESTVALNSAHAVTEVAVEESTTQVTAERETETVLGTTDESAVTDSKEDVDLTLEQIERFLKSEEATDAEDAEPTVSEVTTEDATDTGTETSYVSKVEEPEKEVVESSDIDAPAASEEEKPEKKSAAETATENTCIVSSKESSAYSDEEEENDVHITAIYRDMDTQEMEYEISINTGNSMIRFKSSLEELPNKIRARGIFLDRKKALQLQEEISAAGNSGEANVTLTFNKALGWDLYSHADSTEELIFRGSKVISDKVNAKYNGDLDIEPIGETKSMIDAMKGLVLRNKYLTFWIISGLVASTLGFLRRCGESLQTIIIDTFGDTGSGKTTVAKLAVAMGCNPDPPLDKETFAYDFNSTVTAMYDKLNNNFGFPVLIDDVATSSKKTELLPFLYSCANGVGRGRHNEVKGRWSTVIVITNEVSLLSLIDNTDGILIRILSIGEDSFTQSAEEARAVEEFCSSYHGLPIQRFSQALFHQDRGEMIDAFRKLTDKTKDKLTLNNNLKERAARIIAVYKITATIAKHAFGIDFDIKWLESFLVEKLNKRNDIEKSESAYDRFMQFVSKNMFLFRHEDPSTAHIVRGHLCHSFSRFKFKSAKCVGYIEYEAINQEAFPVRLVILSTELEKWVEEDQGKGTNVKRFLRQWANEGYLIRGSKTDRLVVKKDIHGSGVKSNCYMIKLDPNISNDKADASAPKSEPLSGNDDEGTPQQN